MLDLELQSKPWPRPWHRGWRNVFLPAFCCRFWLRVLLKPLSPVFKRIPLIHSLNWSRAPGNTWLLYSACVNSERFPVTQCPAAAATSFRGCASVRQPGQGRASQSSYGIVALDDDPTGASLPHPSHHRDASLTQKSWRKKTKWRRPRRTSLPEKNI